MVFTKHDQDMLVQRTKNKIKARKCAATKYKNNNLSLEWMMKQENRIKARHIAEFSIKPK